MSKRKTNSRKGVKYDESTKTSQENRSGSGSRQSSNQGESRDQNGSRSEDKDQGSESYKRQGKGLNRRGANDPAFYTKNPQLLIDCASIPWNLPTGAKYEIGGNARTWVTGTTGWSVGYYPQRASGILALKLIPSVGEATGNATDPINIIANSIYSYIRTKVSGRKNYDPCDYIQYYTAVAELDSFVQWMKRVYAAAQLYSDRNWYFGKAIVEANGVDVNDIVANLANFRSFINTFIEQISPWAIPEEVMYSYRRHMLYESVYTEGPSIKEQLYMYIPAGFLRFAFYTDSQSVTSGCLECDSSLFYYYDSIAGTYRPRTNLTLAAIQSWANNLIANITGDEDFGIMSGDTRKAFDRIWQYQQIDESYQLSISADPYVLLQMKNATIFDEDLYLGKMGESSTQAGVPGVNSITYHGYIRQVVNSGNLISDLVIPDPSSVGYGYYAGFVTNKGTNATLLTIPGDECGPADIAEITRLCYSIGDANLSGVRPVYSGSEICIGIRLVGQQSYFSISNQILFEPTIFDMYEFGTPIIDMQSSEPDFEAAILSSFAQFRFAPKIWLETKTGTSTASGVTYYTNSLKLFWQLDNFTLVAPETLRRINMSCMLSEFKVPGVSDIM